LDVKIRGLAERARTADDEYKEHLTTVNIGTVGTFSVIVRNTASGLSPTASPLASLRVLPRRRPTITSVDTTPNPAIASQTFTLTISGTNFDPASAEVLFRGPGWFTERGIELLRETDMQCANRH
jgi:hypothetical protein